jgi:hypothetical protein
VAEYKSSGSTYRRTVQTTYRASYTSHYRSGLIKLLEVLEFRSGPPTSRCWARCGWSAGMPPRPV